MESIWIFSWTVFSVHVLKYVGTCIENCISICIKCVLFDEGIWDDVQQTVIVLYSVICIKIKYMAFIWIELSKHMHTRHNAQDTRQHTISDIIHPLIHPFTRVSSLYSPHIQYSEFSIEPTCTISYLVKVEMTFTVHMKLAELLTVD